MLKTKPTSGRRIPGLATAVVAGTLLALFISSVANSAPQVYSGSVSVQQVQKLTCNVHWYTNLKQAQEDAQSQGKLIVWVHMVGKIDGAT